VEETGGQGGGAGAGPHEKVVKKRRTTLGRISFGAVHAAQTAQDGSISLKPFANRGKNV